MPRLKDLEIESFKHNGFTVTIYQDPDATSPREMDNLCRIACWDHRRYTLGDDKLDEQVTEDEFRKSLVDEEDDELRALALQRDILAVLPVYVIEHSGISISTEHGAHTGWAYITKARAEELGCVGSYEYDGKSITWDTACYEQAIRDEIESYSLYLSGAYTGYEVTDEDGDEVEDGSCWDIDDLEYCREEAKKVAENAEPLGRVHGGCTATCEGSASAEA